MKIQEEMKVNKKSLENCKDRLEKLIGNNNVKGTWTPEEDNMILIYY